LGDQTGNELPSHVVRRQYRKESRFKRPSKMSYVLAAFREQSTVQTNRRRFIILTLTPDESLETANKKSLRSYVISFTVITINYT